MVKAQSALTPLARLVLVIVCLAIAGGFVAGVHYFAIDLPQQKAVEQQPPSDASRCVQDCLNSGGDRDTCLISCGFCPWGKPNCH